MASQYRIYAHIRRVGPGSFVVAVHGEPADGGARIDTDDICDPCSHEEARSGCYRMVARIASEIARKGGEVVDVETIDEGFVR
jgi:hypothetical protein